MLLWADAEIVAGHSEWSRRNPRRTGSRRSSTRMQVFIRPPEPKASPAPTNVIVTAISRVIPLMLQFDECRIGNECPVKETGSAEVSQPPVRLKSALRSDHG